MRPLPSTTTLPNPETLLVLNEVAGFGAALLAEAFCWLVVVVEELLPQAASVVAAANTPTTSTAALRRGPMWTWERGMEVPCLLVCLGAADPMGKRDRRVISDTNRGD